MRPASMIAEAYEGTYLLFYANCNKLLNKIRQSPKKRSRRR